MTVKRNGFATLYKDYKCNNINAINVTFKTAASIEIP